MINQLAQNQVAQDLGLGTEQVKAVADLLAEGATVPFVARYRKEATGSLDEVAIASIRDQLSALAELARRKEAIRKSLADRDILTPELEAAVAGAKTLPVLEDIYLPFRPKRRTRAMVAREKGLEGLARELLDPNVDPSKTATATAGPYVDHERGVTSVNDALAGARDIIAEMASEDAAVRSALRELFLSRGVIYSRVGKGKEAAGEKYQDYFDWQGPTSRASSHRVLALLRGEKEGFLKLRLEPPESQALDNVQARFVPRGLSREQTAQVDAAITDGYRRLLSPSLSNETWAVLKQRADTEAIRVFAENLRELLLAAPLGAKTVLAIDPGFRTGCKVVCLDRQGKLLHNETIYPHTGGTGADTAAVRLTALCKEYRIEAIAVGNGTAGRETEEFVQSRVLGGGVHGEVSGREAAQAPERTIDVVMVNESGASIYSASEAAREEFPHQDLTVRGSVSIGRRLMDPLAELIKIDPQSIGVGQYQHDVDQKALRRSLDDTVMSCVNSVGVEVNTASKQLLAYVSGLGPQLATNVVAYRDTNGPFASRRELLKVPRLGAKAFEQAAGFLRIRNGDVALDAGGVHPERYELVESMARDVGCLVTELMRRPDLRSNISLHQYVGPTVGLPTLTDILAELEKPGRDPRERFEPFRFAEGVSELSDLTPGMKLPGIVTNVTAFGAFVDIGVHQDGLVHISKLADRFVRDPAEVVKVQQRVMVTVIAVDTERKRISLSMKSQE